MSHFCFITKFVLIEFDLFVFRKYDYDEFPLRQFQRIIKVDRILTQSFQDKNCSDDRWHNLASYRFLASSVTCQVQICRELKMNSLLSLRVGLK